MPYIPKADRTEITGGTRGAVTTGELTYQLTEVCLDFLAYRGDLSFAAIAQCVAALECAKLELYRKVAAPYEDAACERNGDVYPA